MTKYAAIEFNKLSEAIAYIEDGGYLYKYDHSANDYFFVTTEELLYKWHLKLFTDAPPTPWYEKLDGTIENGVLCWVSDHNQKPTALDHDTVTLLILYEDGEVFDCFGQEWRYYTPLTHAEIERLMNNAPEEK